MELIYIYFLLWKKYFILFIQEFDHIKCGFCIINPNLIMILKYYSIKITDTNKIFLNNLMSIHKKNNLYMLYLVTRILPLMVIHTIFVLNYKYF